MEMQAKSQIGGLTFLPVPEFDDVDCAFGARQSSYFDRNNLPKVPREFEDHVHRLFFKGGDMPDFHPSIDREKARRATGAWLRSFAPAHEAKVATVAYAFWVWSNPPASVDEAA